MTDEMKRLLDAERAAPPPPAAAKARVLDAVRATVAAIPPPSGPSGGPSPVGSLAAGSAVKLASVFIAGAIAGATVHAIVSGPERVIVEVPVMVEAPRAIEAPRQPDPPQAIAELSIVPDAGVRPVRRPKPERPREISERGGDRGSPELASDLAAERVLIERARSALARRSTADALTAVGEHRARFPSGKLREERLALEVQALVSADRRAEAEARASELRDAFPKSMLLPVVGAALAE